MGSKKYRAKRSELLTTILELDKLNADLRAWGSRGWDFAQKEFDRLQKAETTVASHWREIERLTAYSDEDMTRRQHAEAHAACLEKQVKDLQDKLTALRGAKVPFDLQKRGSGQSTYQLIPGVTTTNVVGNRPAPDPTSKWVQGELFENTEDGKTAHWIPGPWCRVCNLTHTDDCVTCTRCKGTLAVIDPVVLKRYRGTAL